MRLEVPLLLKNTWKGSPSSLGLEVPLLQLEVPLLKGPPLDELLQLLVGPLRKLLQLLKGPLEVPLLD